MPQQINVSIIGATGYTALELLRLLANHPNVHIKYLISQSHSDEKISNVYPHLKNACDQILSQTDLGIVAEESDIVFLTLPHLESQKRVAEMMGKTKIIDLSADFRIKDPVTFEKYYHQKHTLADKISNFTYGFPEHNKEEIAKAQNIANPGCFAITTQLMLLPLKDHIRSAQVVAVTGSTGSGKNAKDETHHPIRNHNMQSYKIGVHQHLPEILQTLNMNESQLSFIPTSGPFGRGIHATAFIQPKKKSSKKEIKKLFQKTYRNAPFVRLKDTVQLADIVGSNFCDLSVQMINDYIVVQATLDNLVKGAAGTAIQNMNLMQGLDETTGLKNLYPLYP